MQPEEFSGGEAPGQANFVLRKLGFTVVRKGEDAAEEENPARKDWSEQEVGLIVADYFTMLEKELLGKPYSKTEHRRSLAPKLGGRSDGSIEFKHANISAVLTGDQDESEKLIEVKTTGLGKFFPFYVTGNEVRCSEDMADQFHLFRVFDFGRTPRVYILTGSLRDNCRLEPTQYRATI